MAAEDILDDPEGIKKVDRSDACGVLERMPEECERAIVNARKVRIPHNKPDRIIIAGMGGSAIGGDLMRDWLKDRITAPLEVYRGYELPIYANNSTLMVAVSYSGDTEETVSAYKDAMKKGCMAVVICSGGALARLAEENKTPLILVPTGFMPRFAISHLFLSLAVVFEKVGLIKTDDEIADAIAVLKGVRREIGRSSPSGANVSKQIALRVGERIPAIYGFGPYKAVAKRIKTQFNENAKIPAKWEFFPELTHNEIVGFESDLSGLLFPIFLRDKVESNKYRARIEIAKEIVSEKCRIFEIYPIGTEKLAKMLSVMYIGDFASVYTAVLRGVDPTPIKEITRIKKALESVVD